MIISPDDPELIQLHSEPIDDLYQFLGDALVGGGVGVGDEDPDESRRFAVTWLDSASNELVKKICRSDIRGAVKAGGLDEAATLATALYAGLSDKAAAIAAAIIMVRRGLDVVCAPYDS